MSKDHEAYQMFESVRDCRLGDGELLCVETIPCRGGGFDDDYLNAEKALCFQVDPSTSASMATNVSLIVSVGHVACLLFDGKTSQIVRTTRDLTQWEAEIVRAWAHKSTERARLLADYDKETEAGWTFGDELLAPAWGRDLQLLVLLMIRFLGQGGQRELRDYPMRKPAHDEAWADRCRRPFVLGLVERNRDKRCAYRVTQRGERMIWACHTLGLGWEASWLLTGATINSYDVTVRRVLVCMAAALEAGPRLCITRVGDMTRDRRHYTAADLRALCAPILRARATYGAIWLSTAIFFQGRADGEPFLASAGDPATTDIELDAYITLDGEWAKKIHGKYGNLLPLVGIAAEPAETMRTEPPLWAEQLAIIDGELLRAFLHCGVYFGREQKNREIRGLSEGVKLGSGIPSLVEVQVNEDDEFLSIEDQRQYGNDRTVAGGFCAFYRHLERDAEDHYHATQLTVDVASYRALEQQTGRLWPNMATRLGS